MRKLISFLSVVVAGMVLVREGMAASVTAPEVIAPTNHAVVSVLKADFKDWLLQSRDKRRSDLLDTDRRYWMRKTVSTKPLPVVLSWRGGAAPYQLTVRRWTDGKVVHRGATDDTSAEVWNLEVATAYVWEVSCGTEGVRAEGRFTTEDFAPRQLWWDNITNVRDLGGRMGFDGRRIRQGLIYRSAEMNDYTRLEKYYDDNGKVTNIVGTAGAVKLTESSIFYCTNTLGIRTDLDLRSDGETWGMTGSPLGPRVRWANVPSYVYGELGEDVGKARMAEALRVFMNETNYPVVFHCSAGADRTGGMAFILGGLLGFSDEDLIRDWEITAFATGEPDFNHASRFDKMWAVFDAYTGATMSARIENYVLELGFSADEIARFRELMLEESGVEWTGFGDDGRWTTAANWKDGVLPTDGNSVAFAGTANLAVNNDSAVAPSDLLFRRSAGAFRIAGNPLTVSKRLTSASAFPVEEAAIRNSSAAPQTFDAPVTLSGYYAGLWCDDDHPLVFSRGLTKQGSVLGVRGTVKVGGTSRIERYLRFFGSGTDTPSCLHVLSGGDLTIGAQASQPLSQSGYSGRLVIDAGGRLTIAAPGRLEFRDVQTIIVNGELIANGHFMADGSDPIFSGTGTVSLVEVHSSNRSGVGKFNRFVGADGLTLRLGGDWTTVDDYGASSPSNAVGLVLRDGTKLVLGTDVTYGPKAGVTARLTTPSARAAVFQDTVTVDTAGHTLTFADPLNAAAGTLVKLGEGCLRLSADSMVRDLTISNGCVRPASWPLAVRGTLTLAGRGGLDAESAVREGWTDLATAASIDLSASRWRIGGVSYRVVPRSGGAVLQGRRATGLAIFLR